MFEKATRLRLRFPTIRGLLSTEDLWTISLEELNELAKALYEETKEAELDFLAPAEPDEKTLLSFEVVKRIIQVKLEEQKMWEEAHAKAQKRQRILAIMAEKEDQSLKEKDLDELKALLEELD